MEENGELQRHPLSHANGGIIAVGPDEISTIKIAKEVLESVKKSIAKGAFYDIMKNSAPIQLSLPITYLDVISEDFKYCHFLKLAANEIDPIQRLKLVITFIISGLHVSPAICLNKGPLNPILGETKQLQKTDGTKIYLEQTCHHPPISHYYLTDPDNLYKCYGHGETKAKFTGLNSIAGIRKGKNIIEFKDGSQIEFNNPKLHIANVIAGTRLAIFSGPIIVKDETNKLAGEITFNYKAEGKINKMVKKISKFFSKKIKDADMNSALPSDYVDISIFQFAKDITQRVELQKGSGSWLESVKFEDEIFWKLSDKVESWTHVDPLLESDSSFRIDAMALNERQLEIAKRNKEFLENIQRNDAKLRKNNK